MVVKFLQKEVHLREKQLKCCISIRLKRQEIVGSAKTQRLPSEWCIGIQRAFHAKWMQVFKCKIFTLLFHACIAKEIPNHTIHVSICFTYQWHFFSSFESKFLVSEEFIELSPMKWRFMYGLYFINSGLTRMALLCNFSSRYGPHTDHMLDNHSLKFLYIV